MGFHVFLLSLSLETSTSQQLATIKKLASLWKIDFNFSAKYHQSAKHFVQFYSIIYEFVVMHFHKMTFGNEYYFNLHARI